MKDILKKYEIKANLKEEEDAFDPSKVEYAARALQGQIQKFMELTNGLNKSPHFKEALAYLKGAYRKLPFFMALESVDEAIEVSAPDLTKMNDRETTKVNDMAAKMEDDVKVVKESSDKENRYIAHANFYVYVSPNENPKEKATELLSLIENAHDGASPLLLKIEPVNPKFAAYESKKTKVLSKQDFLNEITVRQKGYQYKETLDKNTFLKRING